MKAVLEFDSSGNLRPEQPLTLRETALLAVRLYGSAENIKSVNISVFDIDKHNETLITDEVLVSDTDLPSPTRAALPS